MQQLEALIPLRIRRLRPEVVAWGRRLRWRHRRLPTVQFEDVTGLPSPGQSEAVIEDHICMPPYTGSALNDFDTLMGIIRWMDPKTVLELGTAHGNTTANICSVAPEARVITVNAPATQQSGKMTTFILNEDDIGWVYHSHGYGDRVTQILANTLDLNLAELFREPAVDLAIIDACHDTEYVINDFLKVQPYMMGNGIILLHDTHPSMTRHYHGSYRACMLLRQRGNDIRHLAGTSWAIWRSQWPDVGATA